MINNLKIIVLSMIFCASVQGMQRISPTGALASVGNLALDCAGKLNMRLNIVPPADVAPTLIGTCFVIAGGLAAKAVIKKPTLTAALAITAAITAEILLRRR